MFSKEARRRCFKFVLNNNLRNLQILCFHECFLVRRNLLLIEEKTAILSRETREMYYVFKKECIPLDFHSVNIIL